jgi:hypothetical protein
VPLIPRCRGFEAIIEPLREGTLSVGMQWVFVNGVPVIADGVATSALPGQVLRGQGFRAVSTSH